MDAEKRFKQAQSVQEKIVALEENDGDDSQTQGDGKAAGGSQEEDVCAAQGIRTK